MCKHSFETPFSIVDYIIYSWWDMGLFVSSSHTLESRYSGLAWKLCDFTSCKCAHVTGAEKERGPTGTRTPNLLGTMPEPTRQSLSGCCSQPEHGPTLSHQMSQGRKKNVARPELEPRVSRLPCEHSTTELPSHSIDRLHFPPA